MAFYDQATQNQIAQQQIFFLIGQLQQYHANDQDHLAKLTQATELNNSGNVQAAASLVYVCFPNAFLLITYRASSIAKLEVNLKKSPTTVLLSKFNLLAATCTKTFKWLECMGLTKRYCQTQ